MKRPSKNLSEIYLEVSHFLKKNYPEFVTSKKPTGLHGIPVFTFHTIRPEVFEEQLEFLKKNNYITLGLDEFYDCLTGEKNPPERAILLTIDDGRKSVWTYGFPLLKKFGFRATVFVIPGHTKDNPPSPPLVKGGDGGFEDIEDEPETNDKEILSWQEIIIMKDSGLIDFGSHTLYHHKIFTGPEIIDFFGPGLEMRPYSYPAVPSGLEVAILEKPSEFYGMPVYSNDPPMSGKQRFIDDQEFREECIRYYREKFVKTSLRGVPIKSGRQSNLKEEGIATPSGLAMTESAAWEKEMFRFSSEYQKSRDRGCPTLSERFLTIEETAKEIYDNLYSSKKILEERLGKPVHHLCYPFGIWSPLSIEMAKKAGYLSSFCSYIPNRPINKSGDDPHKIVRLKNDYIFRLPGKRRKSLAEIFLHKFKRRLKGERAY